MTHPLDSAEISIFIGNQQILLYQEIQIQIAFWYIVSNSFNFLEPLKIVLINTATILMISAKMVTSQLLAGDVITFVYDFINENSSRDSNYTVDVVMWPKFSNSSISVKEAIITSILLGLDQKNLLFLRGGLGSSSVIWDCY